VQIDQCSKARVALPWARPLSGGWRGALAFDSEHPDYPLVRHKHGQSGMGEDSMVLYMVPSPQAVILG
jgi:hypothetical protein